MNATTERIPCPCRNCADENTAAETERILAERAARARTNRLAFELHCMDLDAGRATKSPAEYIEQVQKAEVR